MKKFFLFLLLMFFLFSSTFAALMKSIDGNTVKVEVIEIKDDNVKVKVFNQILTVQKENIMYISFDEKTTADYGVIVDDKIFSGKLTSYSSTTANIQMNIGEFILNDVSKLKFVNFLHPEVPDIQWFRKEQPQNFDITLGDNYTEIKGNIFEAKENQLFLNIPILGQGVLNLNVIKSISYPKYEFKEPYVLKLYNGYEFKYVNFLKKVNDYYFFDLGYGTLSLLNSSIFGFSGGMENPQEKYTYFILKNGMKFFGDITGSDENNLNVTSIFGEHKISKDSILTFAKIPTDKIMLVVSKDEVIYGDYKKENRKISFNPYNNGKIDIILINSSKENESIVATPLKNWELKTNVVNKSLALSNYNLMAYGNDKMVIIVSVGSNEGFGSYNHDTKVTSLAFDDESQLLYSGDEKGILNVYNLITKKVDYMFDFKSKITYLIAKNKVLYVALENGKLYTVTGVESKELADLKKEITKVSVNDRAIYVSMKDGTVSKIDKFNGKNIWNVKFDGSVTDILLLKNDKYLIASQLNGKISILNIEDGNILTSFQSFEGVYNISPSLLKKYFIVSGKKGKVEIWNSTNLNKVSEFNLGNDISYVLVDNTGDVIFLLNNNSIISMKLFDYK
ncbi:PQQ-binding-like beta-propeller repeat protein [Marinitoga lauensis]|uniref:WD40 domain-containing protein n=1 Tax=Marinitoga lauensis TaxID=2201189 RepID=UPI001013C13E|nr:PQQ-binding-like beta-propeller repeat protein [Marinitoga lauensis]